MRGSRIAVAVAAAAAIVLPGSAALAATGGTHPAAHTTAHATAKATAHTTAKAAPHSTSRGQTVIITCENKAQVRPASYLLACGDGTSGLAKLKWVSWTSGVATATGNFSLDTCTPNCAQGKFITSPVLVVLWQPTPVPHQHGQRQFMKMTIIYTGKPPAHSAQSFTESLWYPTVR
jgi:hypothetical protein